MRQSSLTNGKRRRFREELPHCGVGGNCNFRINGVFQPYHTGSGTGRPLGGPTWIRNYGAWACMHGDREATCTEREAVEAGEFKCSLVVESKSLEVR